MSYSASKWCNSLPNEVEISRSFSIIQTKHIFRSARFFKITITIIIIIIIANI